MSTIPKDDFHDLLLDLISLARDYDTSTESKLIEIEELYQLATDGREELEKENAELKLKLHIAELGWADALDKLKRGCI